MCVQPCNKVVTRLPQGCHNLVTPLPQPSYKVVTTRLLQFQIQGCHNHLVQPCHNLVTTLSQPCHFCMGTLTKQNETRTNSAHTAYYKRKAQPNSLDIHRNLVTRLSQGCHKVVTTLLHPCHKPSYKVVTTRLLQFQIQGFRNLVTRLSQPSGTTLSQPCHFCMGTLTKQNETRTNSAHTAYYKRKAQPNSLDIHRGPREAWMLSAAMRELRKGPAEKGLSQQN